MNIEELRVLVRTLLENGCSVNEWITKTGLSRSTMLRLKRSMGLTRAYGVSKCQSLESKKGSRKTYVRAN